MTGVDQSYIFLIKISGILYKINVISFHLSKQVHKQPNMFMKAIFLPSNTKYLLWTLLSVHVYPDPLIILDTLKNGKIQGYSLEHFFVRYYVISDLDVFSYLT